MSGAPSLVEGEIAVCGEWLEEDGSVWQNQMARDTGESFTMVRVEGCGTEEETVGTEAGGAFGACDEEEWATDYTALQELRAQKGGFQIVNSSAQNELLETTTLIRSTLASSRFQSLFPVLEYIFNGHRQVERWLTESSVVDRGGRRSKGSWGLPRTAINVSRHRLGCHTHQYMAHNERSTLTLNGITINVKLRLVRN